MTRGETYLDSASPSTPAPSLCLGAIVLVGTVAVLIAPHLGVPMLLYPWLGLGLCAAMLRVQRLRFADTGFHWRGFRALPLLIGAALGLAYAAINFQLIGPLLAHVLGERPDLSDFAFVRARLSGYALALVLAWVIGGFYEELVFRGFLHTMLMRYLPRVRMRPVWTVVLTAVVFAAYHLQLGAFGVVNALVFAFFAAAVRQRWPKNLWVVISFHACADMTAFTLMRWGYL